MRLKSRIFFLLVFACWGGLFFRAEAESDAVFSPPFWIKGGASLGTCAQFDAQSSADIWKDFAFSVGWTTAGATMVHSLQVGQLEFGMGLDPQNGLAFDFNYMQGPDYTATAAISQVGFYLDFRGKFHILDFELSYLRFFPDGDGRFYLKAGGGYYQALLDYSAAVNVGLGGAASGAGLFGGEGLGATFEAGREWRLEKNLGIGVFYRQRLAVVPRIHQDNVPLVGGGIGNVGLVVEPNGTINIDDPDLIGKDGSRWAVADLSGFDAGLTFNLYLY